MLRIQKYLFSRKGQNLTKVKFSLTPLKERLQLKHSQFYRGSDQNCQQFIEEIKLYGNSGYIMSSQEGSEYSTLQATTIFDSIEAKCLLLDRYCQRDLLKMLNKKKPQNQQMIIDERSLLGKSMFTDFFVHVFPQRSDIFILDHYRYIYSVDEDQETIYYEDQLTAAYYACNDRKKSIILSKPDPLIYIEDLAMRLSLEELQKIFYEGIDTIKQRFLNQQQLPTDSTKDILSLLKSYAREKYSNELFDKWCLFNASLLHKQCRSSGDGIMMIDQHLAMKTSNLCKLSDLPEFDQIFRAYLQENQKNQYPQIINKELEKEYYNRTLDEDKSILMEKIAILGYLIEQDLRIRALSGENIFSQSIYSKKLKQDDIDTYLKLHQRYSSEMNSLQNFMIVKQEKYQASRMRVVTFQKELQVIETKKQNNNYEYKIHQLSQTKQKIALTLALQAQVNNIISKRHKNGISQNDVLKAVKHINEGVYTRDGIKQYIQILLDANASLGFPLKFPKQLEEQFLPYISNTQKEQLSSQMSIKKPKLLSKGVELLSSQGLQGKPLPEKVQNNDFTDDEEDDHKKEFIEKLKRLDKESVEFQKFVLGTEGKTTEFPYDLGSLTMDELNELGFEEIGSTDFKINSEGEIESSGITDPKIIEELKNLQKEEKNKQSEDED